MAADDETDPATPFALATPSLASVARQVAALSKQLHIVREIVEKATEREGQITRDAVAQAVTSSLTPPPRPSMAAQAASQTARYTKAALAVLGAVAAVAQLLADDSVKGPLLATVEVLSRLLGGTP